MLSLAVIGAGPSSLSLVSYLLSRNANDSEEFCNGTLCPHVPLNDLNRDLFNTFRRPPSSEIPDPMGQFNYDYTAGREFKDFPMEKLKIRDDDEDNEHKTLSDGNSDSENECAAGNGESMEESVQEDSLNTKSIDWKEDGKIKVFDCNGTWMQEWNTLFNSFNIPTLRSPHGSHPAPNHPMSMLALAKHKNTEESSLFQLKATKKMHHGIHVVPSSKLFEEFCNLVVERYTPKDDILVHAKVIDIEVIYRKNNDDKNGNNNEAEAEDEKKYHYFKITIDEMVHKEVQRKYVYAKRVVFAGGSRQTYNMPNFPVSIPMNSSFKESKVPNGDIDKECFSLDNQEMQYLTTDASTFYSDMRKENDLFNMSKRIDTEEKEDSHTRIEKRLEIPQYALRHAWHIYQDLPSCKNAEYQNAIKNVTVHAEKAWEDKTLKVHGVKTTNGNDNLLRFSEGENSYYSANDHRLRLGAKDVMVTGTFKNHNVIEKVNIAGYHLHEDYQSHLIDKCVYKNTMRGALSNTLENEKLLIIGGGLTSSHLCKTAFLHGCTDITLLVRSKLNVKQFDNSNSWLDNKTRKKRLSNFRGKSITERFQFINDVHFPTSITPEASLVLDNLIQIGVVKVFEDTIVSEATYKNCIEDIASLISLKEDEESAQRVNTSISNKDKSFWDVELMDVYTGELIVDTKQHLKKKTPLLSSLTVSEKIKRNKKCRKNKRKDLSCSHKNRCPAHINKSNSIPGEGGAEGDGDLSGDCNQDQEECFSCDNKSFNIHDPQKRKHMFHRIWCATGDNMDFKADPILSRLNDQIPAPSHRNMPILTENCRWLPKDCKSNCTHIECFNNSDRTFRKASDSNVDVWIMGSFAALVLGPDAYNLTGSRRATCLIAADIRKSMFCARHCNKCKCNKTANQEMKSN